jgi:hypothetical protein
LSKKKFDINNSKHKELLQQSMIDLQEYLLTEIDKVLKDHATIDGKALSLEQLAKDLELKIRAQLDKPKESYNRILNLIDK